MFYSHSYCCYSSRSWDTFVTLSLFNVDNTCNSSSFSIVPFLSRSNKSNAAFKFYSSNKTSLSVAATTNSRYSNYWSPFASAWLKNYSISLSVINSPSSLNLLSPAFNSCKLRYPSSFVSSFWKTLCCYFKCCFVNLWCAIYLCTAYYRAFKHLNPLQFLRAIFCALRWTDQSVSYLSIHSCK